MLCEDGELNDLKRRGWASEWKFDGTRVLIIKEDGEVSLQNRHGINYTIRLPEIADAAEEILSNDFKIDGEAVYIDPNGEIEFTPCQRRCATQFPDPFFRAQYPLIHKAFDLFELDGKDLTDTPYMKRKLILKSLLKRLGQTIQYVPYTMNLDKAWQEVTQTEEEGLILKRLESRYEPERSFSWLKVKNWRHDICQVAGWTPGRNTRSIYFGSLVLVKNGKFRGKAGSGFNDWELRKVKEVLDESASMPTPFDIRETWTAVKTDLRVKVKYYKITKAGVMRFPVFEDVVNA